MSPQEQARAVLHRERLEGNDICCRRAPAAAADRTDCMNSLYIIISFPAVLSVAATCHLFQNSVLRRYILGGEKSYKLHLFVSIFYTIFICLVLYFVQCKNVSVVRLVVAAANHLLPSRLLTLYVFLLHTSKVQVLFLLQLELSLFPTS